MNARGLFKSGALGCFVLLISAPGCLSGEEVESGQVTQLGSLPACPPGGEGMPGRAGRPCSSDCAEEKSCGIGDLGTKYGKCSGGIFLQISCIKPADWGGPETAPYCDRLTGEPTYLHGQLCSVPGRTCWSEKEAGFGARCDPAGKLFAWVRVPEVGPAPGVPTCESLGNGLVTTLDEKACSAQWESCVGRDPVPDDLVAGTPRGCTCLMGLWECTSTSRWFRAE